MFWYFYVRVDVGQYDLLGIYHINICSNTNVTVLLFFNFYEFLMMTNCFGTYQLWKCFEIINPVPMTTLIYISAEGLYQ